MTQRAVGIPILTISNSLLLFLWRVKQQFRYLFWRS
jgi:hypothetical protein